MLRLAVPRNSRRHATRNGRPRGPTLAMSVLLPSSAACAAFFRARAYSRRWLAATSLAASSCSPPVRPSRTATSCAGWFPGCPATTRVHSAETALLACAMLVAVMGRGRLYARPTCPRGSRPAFSPSLAFMGSKRHGPLGYYPWGVLGTTTSLLQLISLLFHLRRRAAPGGLIVIVTAASACSGRVVIVDRRGTTSMTFWSPVTHSDPVVSSLRHSSSLPY